MKRYIISALVAVLIASLLPVLGCWGEGAISEKQVIEATYNYLINKAEQLQGVRAELKEHEIAWAFTSAVLDATREAIYSDDGFGKSVEVQFPEKSMPENSIPTSTGALKTFVKYKGDVLWSVYISMWEWEFEFNEKTNEVRAKNNEAAKLLEEITLRTYHNTKYGYSINYPPKWNVLDAIKEGVNISSVSADGTMVSAIFLFSLPKIPSLSLREYAEQRVKSFRHESYQIDMAEGNQTVGGIVADIVGFRFDDLLGKIAYDAKWYFIEKDDKVYEILSIAIPMPVEGMMTNLFDPYSSFQFQP